MNIARAAGLIETSAKKEFNLCPMCWMPLYVGERSNKEDELWGLVQFVFKGKPAFSIEADGSKRERPVTVFGVSELHEDASINCQDCHFIHSSVYDSTSKFNNLWNKTQNVGTDNNISSGLALRNQLNHFSSACTLVDFTKNLFVETGLWGGVYEFVGALNGGTPQVCMGWFDSNNVMNLITNTFSGCRDCNLKMTVNKFISPLFKLLIPEQGEMGDARNTGMSKLGSVKLIRKRRMPVVKITSHKTKFNDETGMLYIILCGMLRNDSDVISVQHDGAGEYISFKIGNQSDCLSWKFRFVLMWCLLQVIFSVFEGNSIKTVFKHHISYVYSGIQDFYLSLLFYSLHCANGHTMEGRASLTFEVFHFFYSSHLPFFLAKNGGNPHNHRSLSEIIFSSVDNTMKIQLGNKENNFFNKMAIKMLFNQLKDSVLRFWNESFKPLSDFIHRRPQDETYAGFFCDPKRAMEMDIRCGENALMELNVQTFRDFFNSGPGYWFHFKQITMAKIEKDCKLYFESNDIELVKQVWANWYGYLCMCVLRLGMGEPRALASRFRLGDSHLSIILRKHCIKEFS